MKLMYPVINVSQNFTDEEKTKLKSNIGVTDSNDVVKIARNFPTTSEFQKEGTVILYLGSQETETWKPGALYEYKSVSSTEEKYYMITQADYTDTPLQWYVKDFKVGEYLYTYNNPPVQNPDFQISSVDVLDMGDEYQYYMEVKNVHTGNQAGEWISDDVKSTEKYPTPSLIIKSGAKTYKWVRI